MAPAHLRPALEAEVSPRRALGPGTRRVHGTGRGARSRGAARRHARTGRDRGGPVLAESGDVVRPDAGRAGSSPRLFRGLGAHDDAGSLRPPAARSPSGGARVPPRPEVADTRRDALARPEARAGARGPAIDWRRLGASGAKNAAG